MRRTEDGAFCFNEHMADTEGTATGRDDLEPFWPSRQAYHFDRLCRRANPARPRAHR